MNIVATDIAFDIAMNMPSNIQKDSNEYDLGYTFSDILKNILNMYIKIYLEYTISDILKNI